jgi:hypothetical protein|tara:strand:- start:1828 stop:2310 length:483 start_codon:yes stop_codon:yes gene_type:complete
MATLTALLAPTRGIGNPSRKPYMQELTIDLTAQAIDCSSGDIVQCITVPGNTVILWTGVQVMESATQNTGTDATILLGTAIDPNEYVTAFDIDGASDLAYAPTVAQAGVLVSATADTLDLTFAGSGATFTAGKLRVFAMLMDVSEIGDLTANEVDRDYLA